MKKILTKSLQLQAQMRILHWQTMSYAEHNAFGNFYDVVDDLIDKLLETVQGKYSRILLGGLDSIQISDYNNLKIQMFLADMEIFYGTEIFTCGIDKQNDAEIDNIVQEIRAEIAKLKYLLTLK